jgi:hypothetical protein
MGTRCEGRRSNGLQRVLLPLLVPFENYLEEAEV